MPNRRDIVKCAGSSLALGLFGAQTGFAARRAGQLPSLHGVNFVTPSMSEGRRLSMAFNRQTQKTPSLRAVCRTAQAVGEAVKWARDTNLSFAVRSSGHCFAGHSMHDDLVIDTSSLNGIEFDADNSRITVGAGALNGHVYETLAASAHALGGGSYGSVCMAGLTLGGGIGYMARSAGLLCDQLEDIKLVDANGNLKCANRRENADLFWASRGGGGGSFGIATEMTYRTTPAPTRNIIYVHIAVPFNEAVRLVSEWQHWSSEMGRETTTHFLLTRHSKHRFLVALTGESTLPRQVLLRAAQKLLGPENQIHENYLVGYDTPRGTALLKNWDEVLEPVDFVSRSDYLNDPVPATVITDVLDTLARHPPGTVKLTFEALGGAVKDIAPHETAYPHRAASYLIEYRSDYRNASQLDLHRKALDEVRTLMKPHVTGGAYVNYANPELKNWAQAYWGENLPRLMDVKQRWDPDNLFRHAQSVPTV